MSRSRWTRPADRRASGANTSRGRSPDGDGGLLESVRQLEQEEEARLAELLTMDGGRDDG